MKANEPTTLGVVVEATFKFEKETLTQLEIAEERETLSGVLLGLLPQRQQYEFKPDDDSPVFYGPVCASNTTAGIR